MCCQDSSKLLTPVFFFAFSLLDVLGLFLKKEREKEDEILIRIFSSMKSVFVADRSLYHCTTNRFFNNSLSPSVSISREDEDEEK